MSSLLEAIIPNISGLNTLPWIVVGFVINMIMAHFFTQTRVDKIMKKIALILLYFFVPLLVFRIFLDMPFGIKELEFSVIVAVSITFMYALAYFYAHSQIKKQHLTGAKKNLYLKTAITNQGRSSAFVGGIILVVPGWGVPAGIFMALFGVALFAVIPYILHKMHDSEQKMSSSNNVLPWHLKYYPYYFLFFVLSGIVLQKITGISTRTIGDLGIYLRFYTALTIPAALYYVGSSMHPADMKLSEIKKLLGISMEESTEHWNWVRQIIFLTTIITPLIFTAVFGVLLAFKLIPFAWFAVIIINTILPITSTNMFLVPYGIDRRVTAYAVTWTTLICVPIVIALIWLLSVSFA